MFLLFCVFVFGGSRVARYRIQGVGRGQIGIGAYVVGLLRALTALSLTL